MPDSTHAFVPDAVVGIYRITGPSRVYIGSSDNIPRRWNTHRAQLRGDRHHNDILQRAWNKHGEAAFTFEVIEAVQDVEFLLAAEQRHLDAARAAGPVYNLAVDVTAPARGLIHTPEARAKMSEAIKASMTPERLAAMAERFRGEANPAGKLTAEVVRQICERLVAGAHPQDLGAEFDVTEFTVYQIRCGKIWAHIATPEMVAAMMAVEQKVWDRRVLTDADRERSRAMGLANKGRPNSALCREVNSKRSRGEGNPKAKLTEAKVAEIKWLLADGVPVPELRRRFKVSPNAIYRIKSGESWGYVQPAPPLTT